MNHETCRERLVDLAYGELSRREASDVEAHLAECALCRAEHDWLAEALGAMRRLPAPEPPPERGDALLLAAARQAAEERRRDSFGRALRAFSVRVAAGTAFAALAVFLVVQVRQGLKSPAEYAAERAVTKGGSAPAVQTPPVPPEGARPPSPPPQVLREPVKPEAAPAEPPPSFAQAPPAADARKESEVRREPAKSSPAAKKSAENRGERFDAISPPQAKAAPAHPAPSANAEVGPAEPRRPAPAQAMARQDLGTAPAASSAAEGSRFAAAPSASEPSGGRAIGAAPESARARRLQAAWSPTTSWAREVERRHAAGQLSEAQKRFDPCPGGDVHRVAWIDAAQRILKLVRERADGALVEEWFDEDGRLREAVVRARAGGGSWRRHVTFGEHGEEAAQDASESGLAPDAPPPPLVRDPSAAFFAGPGCAR